MTVPSEETLMAYADGELDAAARAEVEAALAAHPALAARIDAHRALRARLQATYAPALEEPASDRVMALLGGAPAEVVSLADVRARREEARTPKAAPAPVPRRWLQAGAIAATLVVGVLVGRSILAPASGGPMIVSKGGGLVAQGELAKALTGQLASQPQPGAVVRVGLSFKAADGRYCRTFAPAKGRGMAGVACRDPGVWTVRMATEAQGAAGDYRQAASESPAAVMAAVQDMIDGQPLDAAGETRARRAGWR
jgi:hypothetical protein